jgi:hypothetical protein
MHRRSFIAAAGLTTVTALSGCLSDPAPPPRKSNVLDRIKARDGALRIDIADDPWVLSRYDSSKDVRPPDNLESRVQRLNPVGVAEAKGGVFGSGGGRGATGRAAGGYSSAPKTSHGWAWWHGGDYTDDWYEDHRNEVEQYGVTIAAVGVAYLGSTSEYRDNRPGAGPVAWNEIYESPTELVKHSIGQFGWYRVGVHIMGEAINHDFRWESVDFEVVPGSNGYKITNEWKISPRI